MIDKDFSLAAEFPSATREDWQTLVTSVLKGAPYDKLVGKTYDGLRIEPLYARAPEATTISSRAPAAPWQVMQRVDLPDSVAANAEVLHELENGATGLTLVCPGAVGHYGFAIDPAALERVLAGVHLDAGIALEFDLSLQAKDAAFNFATLVKKLGFKPDATNVRFGFDPIGQMALYGGTPVPWSQIAPGVGSIVKALAGEGFKGPFIAADGRIVHAAGGSEAQELAYALAAAVTYLRALEAGNLPLDEARKAIFFRLGADADQFLTIAKFRALRRLWARVEDACGLTPQPAFVSAETAWRMMTARDPYVNMLRTTIAVTAAGVGGADAISVLPFTLALGLPDRFARRVARNLQLILLEESNLYRVADPAAGSGGIEALTSELAKAAWALFQEIESAGGAPAAIEQGLLQKKVAATRAARQAAVAKRKDALTGTSDYPNLGEAKAKVVDVARVSVPPMPAAITFEPLPAMRLAEPYEALRDKSDVILTKTGARPKVFLANLGRLSDFTARATFAKNFYEAGGIEAVGNDGFKTRDEMIAAFKASGAKLACICSSDKVYEAEAAAAAKALVDAGAIVHLAGRPGDHEAAWNAAGVKTYIYVGCDVLATLLTAHDILATHS